MELDLWEVLLKSRLSEKNFAGRRRNVRWKVLINDYVNINFNRVKDQNRKLAVDFCIKDCIYLFSSVGVRNCGNIFILVAEVFGFREWVREAKKKK